MNPIKLDLRTGLPKARRQFKKLLRLLPRRQCDYAAPCVIGAMMSPAERKAVAGLYIGALAASEEVRLAPGQKSDFLTLQRAYDSGNEVDFLETFEALEAKYAASAIEARRVATAQTGAIHESAIGEVETPKSFSPGEPK